MELVFIHLKVSNVDPITSFCFVKDLAYLGYFHSNVIVRNILNGFETEYDNI